MAVDRVRTIIVENLRTVAKARLDLGGLTVLIGESGTGKSTLIEACAILRLATESEFVTTLVRRHGSPAGGLIRFGEDFLRLTVVIGGSPGAADLEYSIGLTSEQGRTIIHHELLQSLGPPEVYFFRDLSSSQIWDGPKKLKQEALHPGRSLLSWFGPQPPHPAFKRAHDSLRAIEVHLPFRVEPLWAGSGERSSARLSTVLEMADRLELFGRNLASAYQALRGKYGEAHWQETLDIIRLGLGDDVETVSTLPYEAPGSIALFVKYRQFPTAVPAGLLSDGALAWLGFVALNRLDTDRSLLAFDEPDLHLHPKLLMRVLDLFDRTASTAPVLLTTHSDRLLDGLSEPAKSVVLAELDSTRGTTLRRPDAGALDKWLQRYRGIGEIRGEGHLSSVMAQGESDGQER